MPRGWDIRGTCPPQFPRGTHWDGAYYLQPHLLRNAPRICSFSSPRLVLLPKAISNPCQYYSSLPKLSVVLTTWKVFSKFHAPPPVSPSFSPIHLFSNHTLSPPLGSYCPHLCCHPFPLCLCTFQESFQELFKFYFLQEAFHELSHSPMLSSFSCLFQYLYYLHQHQTLHHGGLALSLPPPDKTDLNSVWTLPSYVAQGKFCNCAEPQFPLKYHLSSCYFMYHHVQQHRLYTAQTQGTLFTQYTMETRSPHTEDFS